MENIDEEFKIDWDGQTRHDLPFDKTLLMTVTAFSLAVKFIYFRSEPFSFGWTP